MKMNVENYKTNHLFNLIEQGDCTKVRDFFKQYPETINKISSDHDWTPVMYACRYGNLEMLLMLQEIGFTFDRNNTASSNLLHLSFYSYNIKIVRYLISNLELNMKEISQLIKFSGFLKKKDIALLLLLNGGYVVYSSNDLGDSPSDNNVTYCFNVYPKEVPASEDQPTERYFHGDEDVTADCMILSGQRDSVKQHLGPVLGKVRRYLFDYFVALVESPAVYQIDTSDINPLVKKAAANKDVYDAIQQYL